jgi:NAD(P)-dependent dehydrogenase (short-subunit alcohol dehydrogenase family)
MRFDGKLVVVTGANSGIGRAVALRVTDEGGHVLAVDLSDSAPWPKEARSSVQSVTVDVASAEAPDKVVASLASQEYPVYALVNAAGILRIAPFLEVTRAEWDRVLAVNLASVFFLTQAVCRLMVSAGTRGRIVNVSSVHAVVSEPNAAPYTASKGGMEAMTRTIATEMAPHGINANCVRPGATHTEMSRPIYTDEILRALQSRIPGGEIAPPEWIAAAICYLASEEAEYTTGACLDVDGGYAMNGALPNIAYE